MVSSLAAADVVDEVLDAAQYMVKQQIGRLVGLKRQLKDPAEAEEWQNKGNSLLALPKGKWHKGIKEVEVPDYSQLDDNGIPLTWRVELDPEKDFQANAKLCFKNARKINRAVEKVGPMVAESEEALKRWEADAAAAAAWKAELLEKEAFSAASEAGVLELYARMLDESVIKPPPPPAAPPDPEEEARKAFKRKHGKDIDCYRSPSGHEVVVGRSSKTNEFVSLKLAKGDMMWFHTDNRIPGSHVLIRAPWQDIDDADVMFAAKIAAYHSKAKDNLQAPVMYCKGGDVRKIKGTPTGMVSISGNTYQIMVEPGLPEDHGTM